MPGISRRVFLQGTGAAAAAAGIVAAVPSLAQRAGASSPAVPSSAVAPTAAPTKEELAVTGPLVVHVPDTRKSEVHLMIGTREVVLKDRALVARLARDAARG